MAYWVPLFSALIVTAAVFASAVLLLIGRGYRAVAGQLSLLWDNETAFAVGVIVFGSLPVALVLIAMS